MGDDHNHTVLVVDDDKDTVTALSMFCEAAGLNVCGVMSGTAALKALREGLRPCAAVVDVAMPDMDGWQFVARLRADPRFTTLPVILSSGWKEDPDRMAALRIDTYLMKPVDPETLLNAVTSHCRPRT